LRPFPFSAGFTGIIQNPPNDVAPDFPERSAVGRGHHRVPRCGQNLADETTGYYANLYLLSAKIKNGAGESWDYSDSGRDAAMRM
jgi:hypothetical protein